MVGVEVIENLVWPWKGNPFFTRKSGDWDHSVECDPYPCYSHDPVLVKELAEKVESLFPLRNHAGEKINPKFYLPKFEGVERTNGQCENGDSYRGSGSDRFWTTSSIVLFGKRIPPMQSMTRYLVSHEYGHAVERAWEDRIEKDSDRYKMLKQYAEVRKIPPERENSGGRWHTSTAEIFANDFRILICNTETEFWPHEVERPETTLDLVAWWKEQQEYALKES